MITERKERVVLTKYRARGYDPNVDKARDYFLYEIKGDATIKEVAAKFDVSQYHLEVAIEKTIRQ